VASLGWVSPGTVTEGVTPIFPEKKLDDLFLVITVCQFCRCHPCLFSYFFPEKTDHFCSSLSLLLISLGCHPLQGVTLHLFHLSDLLYALFFVHLPTIFFLWVSPPWRVLPRAVRPPPPSDATECC